MSINEFRRKSLKPFLTSKPFLTIFLLKGTGVDNSRISQVTQSTMAKQLTNIMNILDRNTESLKESEYLEACNLIKEVHDSLQGTPAVESIVDFAARQPLPDVPSMGQSELMCQIRNLENSRWVHMTDTRKIEALEVELNLLEGPVYSLTNSLRDLEIQVLTEYGKLEESDRDKQSFLSILYTDFKNMVNQEIDRKIEMLSCSLL